MYNPHLINTNLLASLNEAYQMSVKKTSSPSLVDVSVILPVTSPLVFLVVRGDKHMNVQQILGIKLISVLSYLSRVNLPAGS